VCVICIKYVTTRVMHALHPKLHIHTPANAHALTHGRRHTNAHKHTSKHAHAHAHAHVHTQEHLVVKAVSHLVSQNGANAARETVLVHESYL